MDLRDEWTFVVGDGCAIKKLEEPSAVSVRYLARWRTLSAP